MNDLKIRWDGLRIRSLYSAINILNSSLILTWVESVKHSEFVVLVKKHHGQNVAIIT
jgi:hypothetical protein